MSTYNLGADHDSDEVVALKSKISVKDNEIAMLKDKLMQSSSQTQEVDSTLKETNYKLRLEADRRIKLEGDLERCCEERQNQKTARDNIELALDSLTEKLKASERVSRDLQATIDQLSSRSEGEKLGSQQAQSNLERENNRLIARVRELEFECRQLKVSSAPQPRNNIPLPLEDPRMTWLEQENDRLRQLSGKYEEDITSVSEKLANLQMNLVQVENEKVANEKRMQTQLKNLLEKLEESGEELEYLRQQGSSVAEREQQLMDRIDEDQAKIEQLVKLIEGDRKTEEALSRAEARLKSEIAKVVEADRRNAHLVREKDDALDALAKAQESLLEREHRVDRLQRELIEQLNVRPDPPEQSDGTDLLATISHDDETTYRAAAPRLQETPSQMSTFEGGLEGRDDDRTYLVHSTPIPRGSGNKSNGPDPSSEGGVDATTLQRLLSAIERIRGERDDLKRQLEFSQMEHKFAVEAYEAKLAPVPIPNDDMQEQDFAVPRFAEGELVLREQVTRHAAVPAFQQDRVKRSGLALAVLSIVIERLRTNLDEVPDYLDKATEAMEDRLSEANSRAGVLEAQLIQTSSSLGEVKCHRAELLSRTEVMEETLRRSAQDILIERENHMQCRDELLQSQSRLADFTKALSNMETERDSLNLQVQHLRSDLASAQQELVDVQDRYSSLQAQKFSAMSSNAANRTLKQQIEDLEARVQRRTEQIGIQQHDIRRMETNLRLQEERIAEMTFELETLSSQKEAMVEDCAEAREARDLALRRVEAIEMEIETVEERMMMIEHGREKEVATLVSVVADSATRTRSTTLRMKQLLHVQLENQRRLVERLRCAEEARSMGVDHIGSLRSEASNVVQIMQAQLQNAAHDTRQAILALAVSQKGSGIYARSLECMSSSKVSLESKVQEQQMAFITATAEISSLRHELENTHYQRPPGDEQSHHEVELRIACLEEQVRSLQLTANETASRHERTIAELTRNNEELRAQAGVETGRLQAEENFRREIQTLNTAHTEEIQSLQDLLDKADAELSQLRREQSAGDDQYRELQRELDSTKEALRCRIDEAEEHLQTKAQLEDDIIQMQRVHSEKLDRLQDDLNQAIQQSEEYSRTCDDLERQHHRTLSDLLKVKEELQTDLTELEAVRDQERQTYQNELRCTVDRSHKTEAELHREILALQLDLEHSQLALQAMTEEKNGLETEMTTFEAEIQRWISLHQYLEKQVKENESEISSLKDELAHVRREYAHVEKNWSTTEVQLSLQDSKHKEVVSVLNRELDILRSKPNLDTQLHDLKERYEEMEELLKAKCIEVEATDDKYLEVLQERRKLNTRLDNLNRKVQLLEKKLAETSSAALGLAEKPPSPSPVILTRQNSTSRPGLPTASTSQPRSRVTAGPSLAKTPQPKPVASESARPPISSRLKESTPRTGALETSEPIVSIGKKRRAPDDFDACEAVPPQVFTPDSLPSKKPENMTPRLRRNATSIRTGFTPVRSKPPSTESRRVTTAATAVAVAATAPSMITDVTNAATQRSVSHSTASSAQSTAAGKRSWLRNVRAAQSTR